MFSTLAIMSSVSVILSSVHTKVDPPVTQLTYVVHNKNDKPVWLVDDGWFTWRQKGKQIELSFAREKMQPGVQVFGYFSPVVVKIEPGNAVTRTVELSWPLSLSRVWNSRDRVAPKAGKYEVSIKVGYGHTPEPGPLAAEDDVETPVLRWQSSIVSKPVTMNIPPSVAPDKESE